MPGVEIVVPLAMFLGLFGTIITVNYLKGRTRLRMKEYELEQMRLANEAKQLELEEHRLRIMMIEQEESKYRELGR